MNGFNNNYGGYANDRNGLGALSRALVFIVVLVGVLAGAVVFGLARDPIEDAQAADMMVGVARDAADLEADKAQMPAISEAEANAHIAQIDSEAQTRAVYDETTRRNIIQRQAHNEALAAEDLAHTQDMHEIVERLTLASGVAVITLVSLGAVWLLYTEINSRMAVRVAARAAQAAATQLAAAQAVAAARSVATPAPLPAPTPRPVTARRTEPLTGRLPGLPTGQPQREQPAPMPQSVPAATALTVQSIPPYPGLETMGHGNGAYPNGHNGNGYNGNGHNGHRR